MLRPPALPQSYLYKSLEISDNAVPFANDVRAAGFDVCSDGDAFIRLEYSNGLIDVILPEKVYMEYRDAPREAFIVIEGGLT